MFQQYDIDTQNLIVNVQILNVLKKIHEISSISKNDSCYYFHTNGNFCSFLKMKRILRDIRDEGSLRFGKLKANVYILFRYNVI